MTTASPGQFTTTPYPGLRPFHRSESDIFFGRDEQVDQLIARLSRHPRFLAVVGTSGCGKSSLVKAGLLSALDAGLMANVGSSWHVADMRPGGQPIINLAHALVNARIIDDQQGIGPGGQNGETVASTAAMLRRGPLGVVELLRQAQLPKYTNLLVLVDQFEEIFRFHEHGDPNEALAFVNLLLATANQSDIPVFVMITMRSDFLGNCSLFPGLPETLNDGQFLCSRLSREQIRESIEGPAAVCGGHVEPALVSRIVNDVGTNPDQLPLMQHALMRMWLDAEDGSKQAQDGFHLTLKGYHEIGGLEQALSRHANKTYQSLRTPHGDSPESNLRQRVAQIMFRCLCEQESGGRVVRRPATVGEIAAVAGVEVDLVGTVASVFVQSQHNFLTATASGPPPYKPDCLLDISHEALIRQWDQLRTWVQTEAESAARYRRLFDPARLKDKGAGDWLTGLELQKVREWWDDEQPTETWAKRYGGHFAECKAFLDESDNQAEESKMRKTAAILFAFIVVLAMAAYANWQRGIAVDRFEAQRLANIELTAAGMMSRLGGEGDYPAPHEYAALGKLADSEAAVRLSFLRQILHDKGTAKQLRSRFPYVLHAIVGLDREMRQQVKNLLLEQAAVPSNDLAINIASAELGTQLDIDEPDFVKMIAENYLAAMEKTTDADALSSLGRALGSLGEKLAADEAAAVAQQIVAAMEKTTDARALSSLGSALGSLGEKLPADEAAAVAQQIVAAMEKTTDENALSSLARALVSLGEKLAAEPAAAGAQQIVAAMEKTTDADALSSLCRALVSLGEKLAAEPAAAGAQLIVAAMEKTTDAFALSSLGRALGSLDEKLAAEPAAAGAQQIVAVMEKTTDARALESLGSALVSLGEKLAAEPAAAVAQQIVAVMEKTTDAHALNSLGSALGSLGEKLAAEPAAAGAQQIVAAMEKTTDARALSSLGRALVSLGEKLAAEPAAAVAQQILAAMEKKSTDSYAWHSLGSALISLGEKLAAEPAAAVAQQIVPAMEKTTDAAALSYLSRALGSLVEKLAAEPAAAVAQQIVAAMENTTDARALESLGSALVSLGDKLAAEPAAAIAQQIVAVMEKTTSAYALSSLGSALVSLVEKLAAEQAAAGAQQIVAVMEKTTDADALSSLGRALGSLGEKLAAEPAAAGAQQIVAVMEKTTDARALSSLGRALVSLGEKLPAEQAAAGAQQIVAAMKKTTDADALSSLCRALGGLGEKLPADEAAAGAQQIVAAMEKTTDENALSSLARALVSLGEKLAAEPAAAGAQQIVAAMEKTTDARALESLGSALVSLGEKLAAEPAAAGAQLIVAAMEKTTAGFALDSLGSTLGRLVEKLSVADTMSILKSLVCVGEVRAEILAVLENRAGQKFDGNLWTAVDWAEGPPNNIDLKNIPRWPLSAAD